MKRAFFAQPGLLHYVVAMSLTALAGCGGEAGIPQQASAETLSKHGDGFAQCPAQTPAELAPPGDERLKIGLSATGVQIYTCSSVNNQLQWTFKAPEADLFFGPFLVGKHFAGPSWQFLDGSTVVTTKTAAATPDPRAIPWLLTQTVSTTGNGFFSDVKHVQRLSTTGGLAPTTGCTTQRDVGKEARVPYAADYFFYAVNADDDNQGCR
jgi:hypothetical protein